jgi:hypothetical protein
MPQGDPYQYLRDAMESMRQFNASEEVDEVHTHEGEKITSMIQSMLADLQKGSEGLMQGKMDPRALSRAMGQIEGGGSPAGGPGY